MKKIQRALISVSKKDGIIDFSKELSSLGVEILSTGGTAKSLREAGIPVTEVSQYTGFPEILDGRVKTLHPKVHGGLLGVQENPEHVNQMEQHQIKPIQMVVVNLYPFEETIQKPDCPLEEAVENIDIGGPSMLRSAAKNHRDVAVLVDPADYRLVLDELQKNEKTLSRQTCLHLAVKAFRLTANYDLAITRFLEERDSDTTDSQFPQLFSIHMEKIQNLRYGENPHQKAAFYRELQPIEPSIANATQLHGKEMSFNNILDANSALELVKEFEEGTVVIIKHNNPCGVASGPSLAEAYQKARETDPISAFGGVIALNRRVDETTAREMSSTFIEVIISPGFDDSALEILKKKRDLRLLDIGPSVKGKPTGLDFRKVVGGLILQDRDLGTIPGLTQLKVVSVRKPTPNEYYAMGFAWKVCKHVKSNAIVFATEKQTVGIGAGQMSRVDSVKLASMKARLPIKGCAMASDAFFPFRDGIDHAAQEGISAIIQPGGSKKDEEVIQAANEQNMTMVFTGMRHFRH
ncbi:MAG TPA: bifunctional phosphoribosylaminoimidazolecarboxamide formyltransferase/IMP cyclohydrolase [Nitrospiria bacterium]|jgi:phosphoribosylaminoimidazolecarboxamide formyltransferase/IMP cyclohydrolase